MAESRLRQRVLVWYTGIGFLLGTRINGNNLCRWRCRQVWRKYKPVGWSGWESKEHEQNGRMCHN